MTDSRFTAKQYIDLGWSVVPVARGAKRATDTQWQKKTYEPVDFKGDDNIAGKCGEPSGWRVDIDCDAPEAVECASLLLPETGLIHGRPGKPSSHYWFLCRAAKTAQFQDVKGQDGRPLMLVEIRATGYTVLPPSIHETGEQIEWVIDRDPSEIDYKDLYRIVRTVALAALIARHYPGPGTRHHFAGPLAGLLLQCKLDEAEVVRIIKTAARVAKDADWPDREAFVRSTIAKFNDGQSVTGGPTLVESLGEAVVHRIKAWFRLSGADGAAFEGLNARHFVTRLGKDTVIGGEDDPTGRVYFQHKAAMELRYANQFVTVGQDKEGNLIRRPIFPEWVVSADRRYYETCEFAPPPQTCAPKNYNLWKGLAVEPAPGDCDKFLHHLQDVVCGGDTEVAKYLCKLLAFTVQFPGIPSEVATVLKGDPGTGKGIFIRAMMKIFGQHAIQLDKVDHLVGNFNSHLSSKVFVFADEAFWAGDKKDHSSLKRIITEPTLTITRKGIDSVTEPNVMHLFMATNNDWAIPAMFKERRWLVLKVSSEKQGDLKYFQELQDELDQGGLAGFLHLLLNLPVTHEEIRRVPKTLELRYQQNISMSEEMRWWQDCLYLGRLSPTLGWPEGWIPCTLPREICYASMSGNKRQLSQLEFYRRFGEYLWQPLDGKKNATKSVKCGKDVVRCGHLRTLADARKFLDEKVGTIGDWPEDEGSASIPDF